MFVCLQGSHAQEFGPKHIAHEDAADFEGTRPLPAPAPHPSQCHCHNVHQHDADLVHLRHAAQLSADAGERAAAAAELEREETTRSAADAVFAPLQGTCSISSPLLSATTCTWQVSVRSHLLRACAPTVIVQPCLLQCRCPPFAVCRRGHGQHADAKEQARRLVQQAIILGKQGQLVDSWPCLRSFVAAYEQQVGTLTTYAAQNTRLMANLCNAGIPVDAWSAALAHAVAASTTS